MFLDFWLVVVDVECDVCIVCDMDVSVDECCIELWKELFVVVLLEGYVLVIKLDLVMMDLVGIFLIVWEYCFNNFFEVV